MTRLKDQPTTVPSRKVTAGSLAGAVTAILVWTANDFFGIEIPADVASAVTVVIAFSTSYLARDKE